MLILSCGMHQTKYLQKNVIRWAERIINLEKKNAVAKLYNFSSHVIDESDYTEGAK